MAKFDKNKLAEACDGLKNSVVNKLCDENLPKKPEDWARLFETQAEKIIEENNKLLPYAFAQILKKETEALAKMLPNNKQNTEIMKLKKHKENQNTENEKQKLKEDAEMMRRHYGMLLDHHIIDFDMFENKVGKENVPEILQEYNKILMKCELAEYEPDFIGICHHEKVNCALQELCLIGFKCNHEHEHSNAKMCYLNKRGGELETFLLKNNTSVPKLLEMEKTIAETQQEEFAKNSFSAYDIQTETNPKGEQKTCYTTYKLTRREQEGKESKQCPHLQFNIGSEYCRTCRYFVSHDHVYRTVKCSYPNPVPDPSLELFKNNQHEPKTPQSKSRRNNGEHEHQQDERVNHPKHYQHPSGVECITVARHHDFNIGNALKYIWRAGLKEEQGLSPLDKQIEDLQKAVWFLQDEIKFLQAKQQEQ